MKTREGKALEKILLSEEDSFRPELLNTIPFILWREEQVLEFAKEKIATESLDHVDTDAMSFEMDEDILKFYVSAVHFANSLYFERPIGEETISILLPDKATYAERYPGKDVVARYHDKGFNQHAYEIPDIRFNSVKALFGAIDAEDRHGIHHQMMHELGVRASDWAERARLVMTECIDEGVHRPFEINNLSSQQHLDPFINDFDLFHEETGHVGAKFVLNYLNSENIMHRQMQLNWLIRLPIRRKIKDRPDFDVLHEMLGGLAKKAEGLFLLDNMGEVVTDDIPYGSDIGCLFDYYRGNPWESEKKAVQITLSCINYARDYAMLHFPYFVHPLEAVFLGGKPITRFASQLDYVALKLATQSPESLYAEAKRKEGQKIFKQEKSKAK